MRARSGTVPHESGIIPSTQARRRSELSTFPASQAKASAELPHRTITLHGLTGEAIPAKLVDVGRGRPVVFLHGLVGLNDHWEDVVRSVQHRVRCIMLELPLLQLRGEDCGVGGVSVLTERFLEQVLGIGRSSDEQVVLVGNSFGGHVALRIALERPDLVGGLVLAGSSGLIERTMVKEITVRPSREWMRRKISELFYRPEIHMREADLDRAHKELTDRAGARAMVKLSRSARSDHLGERIQNIKAPCMLIWGRQDIVTPPEAAHEFMAKLPDARIVWFDECGHAPMIEKPEEFARAVIDFNAELDRRAGV
jgi:2-hydroxy-6-oxonona-2,4-dienedioate hydrolase